MLMCELEPMEYTATIEDRMFEEYFEEFGEFDTFEEDEEER